MWSRGIGEDDGGNKGKNKVKTSNERSDYRNNWQCKGAKHNLLSRHSWLRKVISLSFLFPWQRRRSCREEEIKCLLLVLMENFVSAAAQAEKEFPLVRPRWGVRGQWCLCPKQKPLISVLICQALTKESNINETLEYLPQASDMWRVYKYFRNDGITKPLFLHFSLSSHPKLSWKIFYALWLVSVKLTPPPLFLYLLSCLLLLNHSLELCPGCFQLWRWTAACH